jgi:hypothetical protein
MVHQFLKRGFKQTNKIHFETQIVRRHRHFAMLRKSTKKKQDYEKPLSECLPVDKPELPYQMSKSRERGIDIGAFMQDNKGDLAIKVS